MTGLDESFFARDALVVARALIGTRIVHVVASAGGGARGSGTRKTARIVETEAYRGPRDLACHARAGLTKRTKTLFGPPGHAYVFLIYGMYDCFNVVCKAAGAGHAVLVRGAEVEGEKADGPGKFARAMGFTRKHDGESLMTEHLHLLPRDRPVRIGVSARVGVQYAQEWADAKYRFFDALSQHVSKPSWRQIGRGTSKATPK